VNGTRANFDAKFQLGCVQLFGLFFLRLGL
jgi:hypothetical protein